MSDRIYRNRGNEPKPKILILSVVAFISAVIIFCVSSAWVISYFGW